MADRADVETKLFRFSLRTLLLVTAVIAVLAAILSDRTAVQVLVMLLLSPILLLLALSMMRGLQDRRTLRAFALGLLAICILGILIGVIWPLV